LRIDCYNCATTPETCATLMPKLIPEKDLRAIETVVRSQPGAISAREIASRLPSALSHRTLQFRLKRLVENGRLVRLGTRSRAAYSLPPIASEPAPSEITIPLSKRSIRLEAALKHPPQTRTPVGYHRDLLDSYRPNSSAYLELGTRIELGKADRPRTGQHLAGTYAKRILQRLLIDLSWNSSRLEGNTYSLLDTQRLIELGASAEGKGAFETQMILNHIEALRFLVEGVDEIGFNRYTICNLHATLANNLLPDEQAAGRLRRIPVGIEGSVFHPLEVPQIIEECFDEILGKAEAIRDPLEQSFFAMVHLPYLQPFDDVNKCVARLSANIPLIKANLSPLSFVDVPRSLYTRAMLAVYELKDTSLLRDVFHWAYTRSAARYAAIRQSLGEPDPMRLRYRDDLRELISEIIRMRVDRKSASGHIERWSEARIDAGMRERFCQAVESDLLALNRENFARFRVRLSEFEAWWQVWSGEAGPGFD